MGIEVASSFTRKSNIPLDDATVVADLTARDALPSGIRYEGMTVYVESEETNFQLIAGITNSDWAEFSGSGGGGTGGINYILNSDAEDDTTGYVTYNDGSVSRPVDGTGGTVNGSYTFTVNSIDPLRGLQSFLISKPASNIQGHGVSYDFTIAKADQGKILEIGLEYALASGTYSGGTPTTDSDLIVYIYDVTNARLVEPVPIKLDGGVIQFMPYKAKAVFQSAINSVSYRLIFHQATTSASAFVMQLDTISVGPQVTSIGSMISEETLATSLFPVATAFPGLGTVSNLVVTKVRQGNKVVFKGRGTTGTVTGTNVSIIAPAGHSLDNTLIATYRQLGWVRPLRGTNSGNFDTVTAAIMHALIFDGSDATQFFASYYNNGNAYIKSAGNNSFASSVPFEFELEYPVLGWGASQVLSADADTRVVAARYYLSGNQSISDSSNTTIVWNAKSFDTHNAMNTSTGEFTAPVSGYYEFDSGAGTITSISIVSGNRIALYAQIDAGTPWQLNFLPFTGSVSESPAITGGDVVYLRAGQKLIIKTFLDFGSASYNIASSQTGVTYVAIRMLSGPSQIAASESVSASAYLGSSSSSTRVPFNTTIYDSHGSLTLGASFEFKAPMSGTYCASVVALAASGANNLSLVKNGSTYSGLCYITTSAFGNGSMRLKLLAGETVYIGNPGGISVNGAAPASNGAVFTIERTGNY